MKILIQTWTKIPDVVSGFNIGIIWDLIAKNRKLIEDNLYLTKKQYYNKNK